MKGLLDGQIGVVTGAGSGIGQAIALGYTGQGAVVAVPDVNAQAGQDTVRQIAAAGGKAIFVAIDVTDRAACDAAAASVQSRIGPLRRGDLADTRPAGCGRCCWKMRSCRPCLK